MSELFEYKPGDVVVLNGVYDADLAWPKGLVCTIAEDQEQYADDHHRWYIIKKGGDVSEAKAFHVDYFSLRPKPPKGLVLNPRRKMVL